MYKKFIDYKKFCAFKLNTKSILRKLYHFLMRKYSPQDAVHSTKAKSGNYPEPACRQTGKGCNLFRVAFLFSFFVEKKKQKSCNTIKRKTIVL